MKIEHLGKRIECIPTLASWIHSEWGYLMPDMSVDCIQENFKKHLVPHQIPQAFVAIRENKPVGTASLVAHDMTTRMELSPWLAAVYVESEARRQGIGAQLVKTVMQEAKTLGLEKFYLFTPDQMNFYRFLGWKELEEIEYRGEQVTIMMYEFLP